MKGKKRGRKRGKTKRKRKKNKNRKREKKEGERKRRKPKAQRAGTESARNAPPHTPSPPEKNPATRTPSGVPQHTQLEEGMEDSECLAPLGLKL